MKRFFKVILVLALLAALTYGGYVLHQRQAKASGLRPIEALRHE